MLFSHRKKLIGLWILFILPFAFAIYTACFIHNIERNNMTDLCNKEGQNVPSVNWNMRIDNEWTTLHSDDVFNNKTVILFSLPGAFTPT